MNKKLDRKKQKQVHRYVRAIIQLIFFLLVPSAFTAAFSGVKYLFTQIGKGDAIGMTSFVTALCVSAFIPFCSVGFSADLPVHSEVSEMHCMVFICGSVKKSGKNRTVFQRRSQNIYIC